MYIIYSSLYGANDGFGKIVLIKFKIQILKIANTRILLIKEINWINPLNTCQGELIFVNNKVYLHTILNLYSFKQNYWSKSMQTPPGA